MAYWWCLYVKHIWFIDAPLTAYYALATWTPVSLPLLAYNAYFSLHCCLGFLMPRSYQTFHPVSVVKLLGIYVQKNRCWSTTFHTITAGDADGWCQKLLVSSTTLGHFTHTTEGLSSLHSKICH